MQRQTQCKYVFDQLEKPPQTVYPHFIAPFVRTAIRGLQSAEGKVLQPLGLRAQISKDRMTLTDYFMHPSMGAHEQVIGQIAKCLRRRTKFLFDRRFRLLG